MMTHITHITELTVLNLHGSFVVCFYSEQEQTISSLKLSKGIAIYNEKELDKMAV